MKSFFRIILLVAAGLPGSLLDAQGVPAPPGALWVSGKTVTETGGVYAATNGDTSGVAAGAGAVVTLTDAQISATAEKEAPSSLGGPASGVLALGGARVTLVRGEVRTGGVGSLGLFATGSGTTITVDGTAVSTSGALSPGVRTTSGGGIQAVGGTVRTVGEGSSAVEAAGPIHLVGTVVVALGAEALVVAGGAVSLDRAVLVGGLQGVRFHPGAGVVTINGGALTASRGPLFTVEGPGSVVNLTEVVLVPNSGPLVQLAGPVGTSLVMNADHQALVGDVVGNPGTVGLALRNGTLWTGAIGPQPDGPTVDVSIDATSRWTATADSTINVLSVVGGSLAEVVRGLGGGHRIGYNASVNGWLQGKTIPLADGGSLVPY